MNRKQNLRIQNIFHTALRSLNKDMPRIFVLIIFSGVIAGGCAVKYERLQKKADKASLKFSSMASSEGIKFKMDTVIVNSYDKSLRLKMKSEFSYIPFRPENTTQYYNWYSDLLGRKFKRYSVSIESMGKEISQLIPNYYRGTEIRIDSSRLSKPAKPNLPIVRNISKNVISRKGLENNNIALWHSHGWFYENNLDRWEWQRARVFLTVEDIWTMSFVVPYITPMLENAGAQVFLPRERDIQKNEIIVDADGSTKGSEYKETGTVFKNENDTGFGLKVPFLFDGENPFQMGESRKMQAKNAVDSEIQYIPQIPETGEYSVYISYAMDDNNVTDAHYSVFHSGGKTEFLVNQTIGGGTWIYLGTFRFEKGKESVHSRVELTNESSETGKWISADAVRFGGGMGNVARGKIEDMDKLKTVRDEKGFAIDSAEWIPFVSKKPRYQEGARYYLQYAGMPDTLVYLLNKKHLIDSIHGNRAIGNNDYKDDYQSRGEWVDYLMGAPNGPSRNPSVKGLKIPIDLTMAFHTDAGTNPDSSIVGSLMIYDTTFGPDSFPNGQSRWASRDLADIVQTQVVNDIQKLYEPEWTRRGMWNKQYSEAARPKTPTILSELLSHQNFADMMQANDPRFKFDVSRAFYKGILKFLSFQEGHDYVVQPLPVDHFQMTPEGEDIRLGWHPVVDKLEPTAIATKYRVYTRLEAGGFDNGVEVNKPTFLCHDLKPGVIYSFMVTAVNDGGESFPSEILACSLPLDHRNPILIVNAFDRICGAEAFDNGKQAGFFRVEDEGVASKNDLSFIGDQYDFNRNEPWKDDDNSGFGSCFADHESRIVQGNTFDYPLVHGMAFRNNGFGFISVSDEVFEQKNRDISNYSAVDIIFGEEKTTSRLYGFRRKDFTLFTPEMREAIASYVSAKEAKLFISGAYIGTDLELCGDTIAPKFAADVLHYRSMTNHASKSGCIVPVNSLRSTFPSQVHFVQDYHPLIYKVESPDAIEPKGENSIVLFRYSGDNKSAAVGYHGNYRSIVMGFPFETIRTEKERDDLIGNILKYWGLK